MSSNVVEVDIEMRLMFGVVKNWSQVGYYPRFSPIGNPDMTPGARQAGYIGGHVAVLEIQFAAFDIVSCAPEFANLITRNSVP